MTFCYRKIKIWLSFQNTLAKKQVLKLRGNRYFFALLDLLTIFLHPETKVFKLDDDFQIYNADVYEVMENILDRKNETNNYQGHFLLKEVIFTVLFCLKYIKMLVIQGRYRQCKQLVTNSDELISSFHQEKSLCVI